MYEEIMERLEAAMVGKSKEVVEALKERVRLALKCGWAHGMSREEWMYAALARV